ncbi:MAG: PAS domain S-box protein [Thermoanaerobaculales bacterium]|jgi:PAS domain S-box-containing protein|nr:PAS domain S-box protein [Thermoanaerobaculales bacterium]
MSDRLTRLANLEEVIEKSPAICFIWRAEPGWPVEFVSANINQLGYTQDDFMVNGLSFAEIVHPGDLERVGAEVVRYSEQRVDEFSQVYRIKASDGSEVWVDDRTWVRRDPLGVVVHYQGVLLDITARKLAEEETARVRAELERSLRFNRSLLDALPTPVFFKDREGRYIGCNGAFTDVMGVTSDEIRGKTVHECWPGDHAEVYHQRDLELMRRPERQVYDFKVRDKDGVERPVIYAKNVFFDETDRVAGIVGAFVDISERERAEEERRQAEALLLRSQRLESVGRLAAGVAHDLNNMLTPILGYGEIARTNLQPDDPNRHRLEQIVHAAEGCRNLVRQLLAFSRKQILRLDTVDVGELIRLEEPLIRGALREDIELIIETGDYPCPVRADRGQLEHMLMNLVVNAQDAMPSGGLLSIEIERTGIEDVESTAGMELPPGSYVRIVVADTGEGMSEEVQAQAFEPFFTTKGPGEGTGLGLSTVYGIVHQHGGAIAMHSQPGNGSRFTTYIPLTTGTEARSDAAPETTVTLDRHIVIMVVEDDSAVRELVAEILEDAGCSVLSAGSCRECVDLIDEDGPPPNVLLTDVVMPDGNGLDLARDIQSRHPDLDLKVLFMSGYADDVIADQGALDPDVNFIQKPFTLDALLSRIKTVLDSEPETL